MGSAFVGISYEHKGYQGRLAQSHANQCVKAKGSFPGAAEIHRSALRRMRSMSLPDGEVLLQFQNKVAHVWKVWLCIPGHDFLVWQALPRPTMGHNTYSYSGFLMISMIMRNLEGIE